MTSPAEESAKAIWAEAFDLERKARALAERAAKHSEAIETQLREARETYEDLAKALEQDYGDLKRSEDDARTLLAWGLEAGADPALILGRLGSTYLTDLLQRLWILRPGPLLALLPPTPTATSSPTTPPHDTIFELRLRGYGSTIERARRIDLD